MKLVVAPVGRLEKLVFKVCKEREREREREDSIKDPFIRFMLMVFIQLSSTTKKHEVV